MKARLIPARFLCLIAHLCVTITLLWESQQSTMFCLPEEHHQTHLRHYQKQLIGGFSASIVFIFYELLTFLSGLTMFSPTTAFVSTCGHGLGVIFLAYFVFDLWQCGWFWFIFTFCSIIPLIFDIFSVQIMEKEEENTNVRITKVQGWTSLLILAGILTTFGSSLPVGYNIGVINAPAEIIKKFCNESIQNRYGSEISHTSMNILWSFIVSIFIIGGVTGSFLGSVLADKIGRKGSIILANLLFVLAAIFLTASHSADSIELLSMGRLVVGLASGLATSIVPMYLTEISPVQLRGAMGVLCPLGVTVGVLVGQVMGLKEILGTQNLWCYLLGFYGILTAFCTPFLIFLPESPKFLYLIKSNNAAAIKALSRFRNQDSNELSAEIAELRREDISRMNDSSTDEWTILKLLRTPGLRISLLLVCFLQAGQQTSGINAVFYYSTDIFTKAKLSESAAQFATIGTGIVNCMMAIIAIPLNSKVGRRPLAIFSTFSSALCLICLCITITLIDKTDWMPIVCIFAVLAFVFLYGLGLGPIPYFIGSELFEVGPRPAAMSLGSLCNWGGNFLVGMTFPLLQVSIGAYSFLLFAISTALLCIFLKLYLPETKGKLATEVAAICENGSSLRPIYKL